MAIDCTTVSLQLLLLAATCTAVVATNEEPATSYADARARSPPPSAAAARFLRASCARVDLPDALPDTCYKTLLPLAGSFSGSIARVARAATAVVAARQHGFASELTRLKLRGTGAGPRADMTLASCYEEVASNDMDNTNVTLGRLDRLVAGVRSKDEFDWESSLVVMWLVSTLGIIEDCTDWLNDVGKAAASSPTVKEAIAGCAALSPYIRIALHLAHAIQF
jgi:hypothetical protein